MRHTACSARRHDRDGAGTGSRAAPRERPCVHERRDPGDPGARGDRPGRAGDGAQRSRGMPGPRGSITAMPSTSSSTSTSRAQRPTAKASAHSTMRHSASSPRPSAASRRPALLREIAAEAVRRHARMEPDGPSQRTYYIFRTLRALETERIRSELAAPPVGANPRRHDGGGVAGRLREARADRMIAEFERSSRARCGTDSWRIVGGRTPWPPCCVRRCPRPEFLTASVATISKMNDIVEPLARRSPASSPMSRRPRRAPAWTCARPSVDRCRREAPVTLHPTSSRPDASAPRLVLADISGSVAAFAGFALQLVVRAQDPLIIVRSFVFVRRRR